MYIVADRVSCQFNSLRVLPDTSPLITLQEAHWPDIDAELLIGATNVHRGNIHNRKPCSFLCPVLKHCLAPVAIGLLWKTTSRRWAASFYLKVPFWRCWVSFSNTVLWVVWGRYISKKWHLKEQFTQEWKVSCLQMESQENIQLSLKHFWSFTANSLCSVLPQMKKLGI